MNPQDTRIRYNLFILNEILILNAMDGTRSKNAYNVSNAM